MQCSAVQCSAARWRRAVTEFPSCDPDTYDEAATSKEAAPGDVAMTDDNDADPAPSAPSSRSYPCIIKATNGRTGSKRASTSTSSTSSQKVKISTLVQPEQYASFTLAYGQLLKATFAQTMRAKRKAKAPKSRGAAAAESGKAAAANKKKTKTPAPAGEPPKVSGPRRGPGHGSRQARFRARVKAANRFLASRRRKEELAKPLFPDLQAKIAAAAK